MGEVVGIDLGLNRWAALSDGTFVEGANAFKKHESRLAILQQKLARCVKFSKNWMKLALEDSQYTKGSDTQGFQCDQQKPRGRNQGRPASRQHDDIGERNHRRTRQERRC